jgi:hypothetical protein
VVLTTLMAAVGDGEESKKFALALCDLADPDADLAILGEGAVESLRTWGEERVPGKRGGQIRVANGDRPGQVPTEGRVGRRTMIGFLSGIPRWAVGSAAARMLASTGEPGIPKCCQCRLG